MFQNWQNESHSLNKIQHTWCICFFFSVCISQTKHAYNVLVFGDGCRHVSTFSQIKSLLLALIQKIKFCNMQYAVSLHKTLKAFGQLLISFLFFVLKSWHSHWCPFLQLESCISYLESKLMSYELNWLIDIS